MNAGAAYLLTKPKKTAQSSCSLKTQKVPYTTMRLRATNFQEKALAQTCITPAGHACCHL